MYVREDQAGMLKCGLAAHIQPCIFLQYGTVTLAPPLSECPVRQCHSFAASEGRHILPSTEAVVIFRFCEFVL
jgi:hypothetical protein